MKNLPSVLTRLAVLVALVGPAAAQTVTYNDFSNPAGMSLNGMATLSGNDLRVAPSGLMNTGSAFYSSPLQVANGFDTTFTCRFTVTSGSGGSGMAFVIHNDPAATTALGAPAHALGYGVTTGTPPAITNSLVVEMDLFQDTNKNDPSGSHLSIHTGGLGANDQHENFSLGAYSTPTDMSSGALVHTIRVRYVPGTLEVYYDNSASPVISIPYTFAAGGTYTIGGNDGGLALIGGDSAYVGFTAAMPNTTAQLEHHDVLSWNFASTVPPIFPGNGADAAIELSLNGALSAGAAGQHVVQSTDLMSFRMFSPAGSLDGQPFALVATAYGTGMPPAGLSLLPGDPANVWIDPTNAFILLDGLSPTTPFIPTLVPGGFNWGPFPVPAGLSGLGVSISAQLFALAPGLNPVNIGVSDGLDLQFP
ncbi:MAG: L-type lectin-domain containing protein [Planctomycetota bacterium]